MLLSSSTYFVFLVAVFFLYWPLARWRASAMALILFANYFFFARWDLIYLILIPVASTIDFTIGLGLQSFKSKPVRRLLVTLSIVMNLGMLAFFKYMPFLFENWAAWSGKKAPEWHWSLPVTLSFYVFQSLTYTIDLYRRDAKGTRSLLAHLTAVSFFPTMLAGPITRVQSLIDQMEKRKPLDAVDGGRALFLIGLGLLKKLAIADYLAENLVNRVFDFPNLYSGTEVLVAVYGYAFQLYYDFSGYTDIAIGSALLLGLKLPANFNRPYMAENLDGLLAALAYLAVELAARLPVLFAAGDADVEVFLLLQSGDHDGDRRPVARRELELRDLGSAARFRPGGRALVAERVLAGSRQDVGRVALREHLSNVPLCRVRVDLLPLAGPRYGVRGDLADRVFDGIAGQRDRAVGCGARDRCGVSLRPEAFV